MESLSQQLDAMLHSNSSGDFSDYMEGELAILQNELAKLTRQLAEQNQALENDKNILRMPWLIFPISSALPLLPSAFC